MSCQRDHVHGGPSPTLVLIGAAILMVIVAWGWASECPPGTHVEFRGTRPVCVEGADDEP